MRTFRRTTRLVTQATGDGGQLVVAVHDGAAELGRAAVLDAAAWRAFEGLGAGDFTVDEARAALGAGATMADATSFLEQLVDHDLCRTGDGPGSPGPVTSPAGPSSAEDTAVVFDTPDIIALARSILASGHRLRFTAHGASMRPQVPDRSWLEIERRAPGDVHHGDVVLYAIDDRLVAHRVVGRDGAVLTTRGDSAARLDRVDSSALLGVVTCRLTRNPDGEIQRVALATPARRATGLAAGFLHRVRSRLTRVFVVAPLQRVPILRRGFRALLGALSEGMRRCEARGFRTRRRLDVVRAALRTTEEKAAERRRLYAEKSVRDFTALDENVEAGLTLLEEIALVRHPLPDNGRALVLGCGPGRECVALARLGQRVTGLDYDATMLDAARALGARHGVEIELIEGDATEFDLGGATFDSVVIFSGLYNMVLPTERRIAMLESARRHLVPSGCAYVTFLSDYVRPGTPAPPRRASTWSRINPEHEDGDLYLLNETIHVFPHPDRVRDEAHSAGLSVTTMFRDQRAYERTRRQVLGYAILERPA